MENLAVLNFLGQCPNKEALTVHETVEVKDLPCGWKTCNSELTGTVLKVVDGKSCGSELFGTVSKQTQFDCSLDCGSERSTLLMEKLAIPSSLGQC